MPDKYKKILSDYALEGLLKKGVIPKTCFNPISIEFRTTINSNGEKDDLLEVTREELAGLISAV